MGERRRIPKKSISRHMWRHILTVGAWIIIFIIMGTINMVMMMTTMVSNVKTFVKIEAICNSGGQTTNVSGRANKCVCKSGRVSQAKQIDALEMRAPHVSVWFPLERGPICNEVRVSEAFQI